MFGQRTADPQPGTHYRSSRVSAVNGQYFFATREGTLEGPYLSRHDAEQSIARYIERMTMADKLLRHSSEHIDNLQRREAIKHNQEL
ncbi:hypothetical protein HN51_11010 [Ectopseudomonas mendocina]|uniref:DUF6316 domain-containing protein n=1 Tax=Ectopseudomonas mendocina S5.2 TaxID=1225174 RepID=A0ABM5VVD4_ECTME|nr:hypothetical protein DW68_009175 [Pseudomonas mendocina S5.2]KES00352.1 hypothetical protein HN51_11010 [Pseudomonas mendocina]QTN46151.1 hypothetical protein H7683_00545 [Pseudomonas mendocina]